MANPTLNTVIDLRPRFLPDPQLAAEWGPEGVWLNRFVKQGVRVPPMAAWGASQVRGWLESLPAYQPLLEAWRLWGNPYSGEWEAMPAAVGMLIDLREQILSAPMPFHFAKGITTIHEMLCGGQAWPLRLYLGSLDRSESIEDPKPFAVWSAFRELVALQFSLERAVSRLQLGLDPRKLEYPVLIQPVLDASLQEMPELVVQELEGHRETLAKQSKGQAVLEHVWDGEQLWIPFVRVLPQLAAPTVITREMTRAPFENLDGVSLATWSALQRTLKLAQGQLLKRFGIRVKNLSQAVILSSGRLIFNPEAVRIQPSYSPRFIGQSLRAISKLVIAWAGGQERATVLAEYRLMIRLASLRPIMARIEQELRFLHDDEEESLKRWIMSWSETYETAALLNRVKEIDHRVIVSLTRGIAAWLVRENLMEVLSSLADLRQEPAAHLGRLRGEWAEAVAAIVTDENAEKFVASLESGRSFRAAELLGPSAGEKWRRFLERFGNWGPSLDLAEASWVSDPSQLAPFIRASLIAGSVVPLVSPVTHWKGRQGSSETPASLVLAAREVSEALEGSRLASEWVSKHRTISGLLQTALRRVVLGGGEALVRKQFIRVREDALLLSLDELLAAFDSEAVTPRFVVEARRSENRTGDIPTGLTRSAGKLRAQLVSNLSS